MCPRLGFCACGQAPITTVVVYPIQCHVSVGRQPQPDQDTTAEPPLTLHHADGLNPAAPIKPWNDDSSVNTNTGFHQGFISCETDFVTGGPHFEEGSRHRRHRDPGPQALAGHGAENSPAGGLCMFWRFWRQAWRQSRVERALGNRGISTSLRLKAVRGLVSILPFRAAGKALVAGDVVHELSILAMTAYTITCHCCVKVLDESRQFSVFSSDDRDPSARWQCFDVASSALRRMNMCLTRTAILSLGAKVTFKASP